MATTDFSPVLIKDSRINNITDTANFGVYSGASSSTFQSFPATATSATNLSFNIQVPSENIVVSRDILVQATYKFTITVTNIANTKRAFDYALTDAFQAFPLNSSIVSANATINNSSVSINTQDVLPQLLRMIDPRDLQKYQGMTPTMPDMFKNSFPSTTATPNSQLSGYNGSSYDNYLMPRGCHPLKSITVVRAKQDGTPIDGSVVSSDPNQIFKITIEATFTEPLFLSPFLFGGKSDYNNQGFVGISTINLNLNMDSQLKRFWSSSVAGPLTTAQWSIAPDPTTPIYDAKLLVNFLTTQPSDLIKARNVIPYTDFPRYITGTANSSVITAGNTATISTQNIQLNQIPDLFIICARKSMSSQTCRDTSTFYPLTNISVNFNNASGLLASASTQELWRLSKTNGSQQSWLEYSGYAGIAGDDTPTIGDLTTGTSGSLLVINPARDLSLPAYLSNGSIGQYNFQATLNIKNNTGADITPEIVVICVNSGIFTTISGSSAIYTGLLTKQMVLDVSTKNEAISSSAYNRLVGGSLSDMVSTGLKYLPVVKKALEIAACGGGACSGGAYSAGASSGGASSGGRRRLDSFV